VHTWLLVSQVLPPASPPNPPIGAVAGHVAGFVPLEVPPLEVAPLLDAVVPLLEAVVPELDAVAVVPPELDAVAVVPPELEAVVPPLEEAVVPPLAVAPLELAVAPELVAVPPSLSLLVELDEPPHPAPTRAVSTKVVATPPIANATPFIFLTMVFASKSKSRRWPRSPTQRVTGQYRLPLAIRHGGSFFWKPG
jgi:hypothetical protein